MADSISLAFCRNIISVVAKNVTLTDAEAERYAACLSDEGYDKFRFFHSPYIVTCF